MLCASRGLPSRCSASLPPSERSIFAMQRLRRHSFKVGYSAANFDPLTCENIAHLLERHRKLIR